MLRNNLLFIGTVISLSACGGSSDAPATINESNASSTTKAILQQVTGVAQHAQLASSKKSSGKSTVKAGIIIEQSLGGGNTSTVTCTGPATSAKSQPSAGITIEEGTTGLDVYYADCPKTASSSESSGTGITIAQNFSDLLVSLCLNTDGSASFDYDDSNSNNILDLGETSHANYTNCQFSNTLSFDGKQSIAVSEFFPGYKAIMVSDNYSVTENGKTLTSNGKISLSASDADGTQRFRAEFTELNESSGLESTILHSGFIESSFSNAGYEIQQDILVSGGALAGKLSIKTEPSLKGSMLNGKLQPPSSGQLKATAEDGSYIIINADDGDNNADTFNLTVNNGATITSVQKWSEL